MIQKNKRILIFNVNWLGDVLFSTATIRNLRRNYPDSYLACVIPSRCYPILKDNPYLNEILIFDERDRHKGLISRLNFIQSLKLKKFDMVFLLHRSFTRALICRLADIPERIGYHTKKRGFLLTKSIPAPPKDAQHRIDYYLNVIEKAGLRVEDRYTDFYFGKNDEEFVADFLKSKGLSKDSFLAAINPGGNWLPKRWPKEFWAKLADQISEKFNNRLIITGSQADLSLAQQIQDLMLHKPVIACGLFNLKQLGALSSRLDLFITADTGPLHIANSVKTKKIISIFGPTSPKVTGPVPSHNTTILQKIIGCKIPCYEVDCKDNRCMKAVTPEEVFSTIEDLFPRK